ncbi:pkd2 [Symbiodinium sp. KB8]|nr:pkd2 [Symbiodinium sp. KB8]
MARTQPGDTWEMVRDDTYGEFYFFNARMRESTWIRPTVGKVLDKRTSRKSQVVRPRNLSGSPGSISTRKVGGGLAPLAEEQPAAASSAGKRVPTAASDAKRGPVPGKGAAAQKGAGALPHGVSGATSAKFLAVMMQAACKDAKTEEERLAKAAGVMKNFAVGKRLIKWARNAKKRRNEIQTNFELTSEEDSMNGALPVREMVQVMYSIRRDRTVVDAVIFTVYTLVFVAIIGQLYNVNMANNTNAAIMDLFLDEEFPGAQYKKNFFEIMTMGEFWTWLRGPVAGGLYPDEWYNGDAYTESEEGYILNYLRLVGGVQLRQARVSDSSCTERRYVDSVLPDPTTGEKLPRFDTKDETCYAEFSIARQDTSPFGPNGTAKYFWSDGWHSLDGLYGWGPSYGDGGYVVELPVNRTAALAKIEELYEDRWVDAGTRSVMVMFNVYNTNTRMLTSFKFFSLQMIIYESVTDNFRAVGEVIFFLMYLYYIQRTLREFVAWNPIWAYPFHFRHAFEITRLVLTTTLFVNYFTFVASPVRNTFTVNATGFSDMYDFAEAYINTFTLAGVIGVLHALKFFEYLALNKRMNTLWITLGRAGSDLMAFVVGLLVIVTGFAFMGMLIYGFILPDFHNFASSFSTLLRFPLGDFDYRSLIQSRPAVTAVFFTLYVAVVFLVCMNMIIAIITKYYEEVQTHLDTTDKWKLSVLTFEAYAFMRLNAKAPDQGKGAGGAADDTISVKRRVSFASMAELEKALRREEESDARQHSTWKAESRFTATMAAVMHTAKKERSLDLYAYLDKLMEASASDHMYIAVRELRYLVLKKPASTKPVKDVVLQLYTAYRKWKHVTIVGDAIRHMPTEAFTLTNESLRRYHVVKVNTKNAVKHDRIMVIDPANCTLLNFDRSMRLKKKLPLIQLLQIETMVADPLRVNLIFSSEGSRGAVARDEVMDRLLEVTYGLYFNNEKDRDAMIRDILGAQGNFDRVLDYSVGRGSSGKSKVLKRRNSIITKLHRHKATQKYEQLLKTGQLGGGAAVAGGPGKGKGKGSDLRSVLRGAVDESLSAMFLAVTKQSVTLRNLQAQMDDIQRKLR